MKVSTNLKTDAQSAYSQNLAADSQELGNEIQAKIDEISRDLTQQIAEKLSKKLEEIATTAQEMLGDEHPQEEVLSYLDNQKEDLSSFIDFSEMDSNSKIANLSMKVTALENRTLGSMAKEEVKNAATNLINNARNLISEFAQRVSNFYQGARTTCNNTIQDIKTRCSEIAKAWDSVKDSYHHYNDAYNQKKNKSDVEMDKDASRSDKNLARNKRYDYAIADQQKVIDDLQNKIDNAKGVEKLIYKTTMINEMSSLERLQYQQDKDNFVADVKDTVSEKAENAVSKVKDTASNAKDAVKDKAETAAIYAMYAADAVKEAPQKAITAMQNAQKGISNSVSQAKASITQSAQGVRDKAITSLLNKMQSATNAMAAYAQNKGIALPTAPAQDQTLAKNDVAKDDKGSDKDEHDDEMEMDD